MFKCMTLFETRCMLSIRCVECMPSVHVAHVKQYTKRGAMTPSRLSHSSSATSLSLFVAVA